LFFLKCELKLLLMNFYDKLGDILRDAIDSGEFLKEKEKTVETLQNELEKRLNSKKNLTDKNQKINNFSNIAKSIKETANTRIDEQDKEKAKSFSFAEFAKTFYENNKEQAKQEPKVQIYKFVPLVIPQNVLYALNMIGIPQSSDYSTAKKIYHEKLMYYHPDKWINTQFYEQAKENTQILNNCWEVIEWWFVAR